MTVTIALFILIPPLQIDTGFLSAFVFGGFGAMAWAVVQVYRAVKNGAASDEQDEYTRMERAAAYEYTRRTFTETERDYWHRRSAAMEYELTRSAGVDVTKVILASVGEPPQPPTTPEPIAKTPRPKHITYDEMMQGLKQTVPDPPAPKEDE